MGAAAGVPGVGVELWMFWIIPLLCAAVCALINTIFCGLGNPKDKIKKEAGAEKVEEEEEEEAENSLWEAQKELKAQDEVGTEEEGSKKE